MQGRTTRSAWEVRRRHLAYLLVSDLLPRLFFYGFPVPFGNSPFVDPEDGAEGLAAERTVLLSPLN